MKLSTLTLVIFLSFFYSIFSLSNSSSLFLNNVDIIVTNGVNSHFLSDFKISTDYGNLISKSHNIDIRYESNGYFNFTTDCYEGSVQTNISFAVHNITHRERIYFVISVNPIEHEYIFPVGDLYTCYIEVISNNPNITFQVTVINNDNTYNEKIQNSKVFKPKYTINETKLNLTICNTLNFGKAELLAGSRYWGIPDLSNIPYEINLNECKNFTILPLCSGGLMGAYLTYINTGIQHDLNVVLAPQGGTIETTKYSRCYEIQSYGPNGEILCTLGPNK